MGDKDFLKFLKNKIVSIMLRGAHSSRRYTVLDASDKWLKVHDMGMDDVLWLNSENMEWIKTE